MSQTQQNKDKGEDKDNQMFQPFFKLARRWAPAFGISIILIISCIAIGIRVFSVIRYESIIHEFDPWFNYRTTQFLVKKGFYGLWNWFDAESWYPLGRAVGGTVYPGLMMTSGSIYWILHALSIPVDIRNVCVFLAPVFSAMTAVAAYLLTKEITKRSEAGLFSALFMAIVPSYISRSVAGSYDNEGVSIFALVFTFYLFIKSVNTGSMFWSGLCSLSYFYMISAWGGYAFITNIIPIFTLFLFMIDRATTRLFVAYNIWYVLGTLLAMQIPFVGFQATHSSEHMASHGVFIFLSAYYFVNYIKKHIGQEGFKFLQKIIIFTVFVALVLGFLYLTFTGQSKWSGRSMTLLDPTYAKKYIPIIASVSEHQATTWSSFFFDLHFLVILTPIGLYQCFKKGTDGMYFAAIYVVLSVYFASVMVRLLLVLAPAVCIVGGIGASTVIRFFTKSLRSLFITLKSKKNNKERRFAHPEIACIGILLVVFLCSCFVFHGNVAGAEAYSSPSIILSSRGRDGTKHIIDDYREAYYWLRSQTKSDAKILSWWDYGYQITGMSNRTVLVDNNTWNNTHIATVGLAMASNEDDAYEICQKLDVDYVLVIFGGYSYYSGDDINKFLWMVRIAGGVYPHIKEEDYYNRGQYRVDQYGSETLLNSLMYRLSFYRFDEVMTAQGKPAGWDTVRNQEIGNKGYKLKHFEEAFTSENWIVRIFKVKDRANRDTVSYSGKNVKNFPSNLDEFKFNENVYKNHKYANKVNVMKRRKSINE